MFLRGGIQLGIREIIKAVKAKFGDGWRRIVARLQLWTNSALAAYTQGQIYSQPPVGEPEPTLTWKLGQTEQHCSDCLRLDGVTLTTSEWRQAGIQPQSPQLECGGWHCDCSLVSLGRESDGLGAI